MCFSGIHEYTRDDDIRRETTGEVKVCENNLVRRIMGVKRANKGSMDE